jgi:N-methylhydantoinase A
LRDKFDLSVLAPSGDLSIAAAQRPSRDVYFGGQTYPARVYDRLALPQGADIPGPAVLEQQDATIWVEPGFTARVDRFGNLIVTRKAA